MRRALCLGVALTLLGAPAAFAGKLADAERAFALGEDDTALKLYTETLADPASDSNALIAAHFGRGEVLVAHRKQAEAVDDFTAALDMDKDPEGRASTLFSRGDAYLALRKYPEAIADYNEVLRLSPDMIGVHYQRGTAYTRLDKKDEALADIDAELKLQPELERAVLAKAALLGVDAKLVRKEEYLPEAKSAPASKAR